MIMRALVRFGAVVPCFLLLLDARFALTDPSAAGASSRSITSIEDRKTELNDLVLASSNRSGYAQPILAYMGSFPLDDEKVQEFLTTEQPFDFTMSVLIRILFFVDGTDWKKHYDDMILPTLKEKTYWFTTECCAKNTDSMASENHMALWMAHAWLLQQREGWEMDERLRQRIIHFLQLKIEYGYYEFLSVTYGRLALQGLMNLFDFCQDEEIQSLAEGAIRRWVADHLLFVNSIGLKYSVSGRDYASQFGLVPPFELAQDRVIYLLTGMARPSAADNVCADSFLSTSSINLTDIVAQWEPSVNTTFEYGHSLKESFRINSELNRYDRTAFQFSQGAYFHPAVAKDTMDFIQHYAPLTFSDALRIDVWINVIPSFLAPIASFLFRRLSVGSVLSGGKITLYRNNGSMLSSVENFWPGFLGFQSFPVMGVCDEIAVWTQSGQVTEDWFRRARSLTNIHLPFVVQQSNVALIMYKPYYPMILSFRDVSLFWPDNRFDEVMTVQEGPGETKSVDPANCQGSENFMGWMWSLLSGQKSSRTWVLGRKGGSYIAVYLPCGERKEKGWFSCGGRAGRQVWAMVASDATKHSSFEAFASVIKGAKVEESVSFRLFQRNVYEATLSVDGKTLHHEW